MEIIVCTCAITLALIIWFKTSAFVEYMRLFRLGQFFKVNEYHELSNELSYIDFLKEYYNNFITRLLSCPICTSVWLGFLSSIIVGWSFIVPTVFGLLLYLVIAKLL